MFVIPSAFRGVSVEAGHDFEKDARVFKTWLVLVMTKTNDLIWE